MSLDAITRICRLAPLPLAICALLATAQPEAPPSPAQPPATTDDAESETSEPQEVEVFLEDGQSFTGLLLEERPDALVLRIAGIKATFPTTQIKRYTKLEPVEVRYWRMRETMGRDVTRLLVLVEWLRDRERYDLALVELDRILEFAPGHAEALLQVKLITKLRDMHESGDEQRPSPTQDADAPRPGFPLLSPDEINLIKVYEVDLDDPPDMVITRDTIERLLKEHVGDPLVPTTREGREAYLRKRPEEILDLMFRLQARPFYDEVRVDPLDQPNSMRLFRDEVHATWLINACATTACHGGADAGRLRLYPRRPRSDRAVYTNFIILERHRLPDGTPLINYDDPKKSPLLQAGLPRSESLYPHPEVLRGVARREAWRPLFRKTDDLRYRRALEWIEAMYRPRPEYPVEYTPPPPPEPPPTPSPGTPGGSEPDGGSRPEPIER